MVWDSSKCPLWEGAFIRGRRLKEGSVYFIFPTIWGAFIGGRRLKEGGVHWRIYGNEFNSFIIRINQTKIYIINSEKTWF